MQRLACPVSSSEISISQQSIELGEFKLGVFQLAERATDMAPRYWTALMDIGNYQVRSIRRDLAQQLLWQRLCAVFA